MKKLFFVALCLGMFFHIDAQDDDYDESYEYVFDNHQFYAQVGPSIPMGGGWKSLDNAKVGFASDLGMAFYLKRLNENIAPLGVGIDWNFMDLSINRFEVPTNITANKISYVSIGTELGPFLSYHITDEVNLDGFYRVGPNMLFQTRGDGDGDLNGHVGWKHSVGASIRFSAMKLSLEADIGKLRETTNNSGGSTTIKKGFHAFEIKFGCSI